MEYWVKKLQMLLGIKPTGKFDDATLTMIRCKRVDQATIKLVQEFLNRINCPVELELTGTYDKDTCDMITYFHNKACYKLNVNNPANSHICNTTWELIADYCRLNGKVEIL